MLRVKQKGKERIGLGENGTNETAKRRPQSEAEETTRGWMGGLEGLWGGALQGCERDPRKDAERAIREGSNGEDYTSQGTRTLSAWLGLGDAVGPLEQRYPRGSTWPLGDFRPND
jgi:hypothetical protein